MGVLCSGSRQVISGMGLIWSVGASFRLIHIVGRIPFLDVAGLGFPEPPPRAVPTGCLLSSRLAGGAPSWVAVGSYDTA